MARSPTLGVLSPMVKSQLDEQYREGVSYRIQTSDMATIGRNIAEFNKCFSQARFLAGSSM